MVGRRFEVDWPETRPGTGADGPRLSQETKRQIERLTGNHIANRDACVRDDILLGRKNWAGERLLHCLVQRLPPNNPRLPVVTPNYDMLIEYACAKSGDSLHHGVRRRTHSHMELETDAGGPDSQPRC